MRAANHLSLAQAGAALAGWLALAPVLPASVTAGPATLEAPPSPAPSMPQVLTLETAKQWAFQNNWDLLAARSDVDLATARKIVAREFPNPSFSWSTSKVLTDGQSASTPGGNDLWHRSYDTVFAINQLFEIGGKRASRKALAQAGLKAAEARLRDARRMLDLAVAKGYIAVLLAETNREILQTSARLLREEARIATTRLKAGDISSAEKSQIEIAADRLELDAQAATANATRARIEVDTLLGQAKPSGLWSAGDSLETLSLFPFSDSVGVPGATRPDLVAAEATLQKAEADVRLEKARRIPDPSLLVQYEHEPPNQPNTVGFGLSFPLPFWNRNQGAIEAASAARQQAAWQVEQRRAQIAGEIAAAEVAYHDASSRWQRHRETVLPKSAEVRKTVAFAYEKGGASLLDLLSAQRSDNEERLATAQAAAETAAAAATMRAALAPAEYAGAPNHSNPNHP